MMFLITGRVSDNPEIVAPDRLCALRWIKSPPEPGQPNRSGSHFDAQPLLLASIDPVLEPSKVSAGWLDQQEQAMGVAHLIGLRTWFSISDGHIGKCHDFNPFHPEWPPA